MSFTESLRRKALLGFMIDQAKYAGCAVLLGLIGLVGLNPAPGNKDRWESIAIGCFWELGMVVWLSYLAAVIRRAWSAGGDPLSQILDKHKDPQAARAELDADFPGEKARSKTAFVGRRWLCYLNGDELVVLRADQLIWAYLEAVRHRVNYIPVGTTYQVVVWDRTGASSNLVLKEPQTKAAIEAMQSRFPWMVFGCGDAVVQSWNHDRDDLIAFVDARRAEKSWP